MRNLVDPLYERVGYEQLLKDKHLDIYLRMKAVAWACHLGHSGCVEKTSAQYTEWMGMQDPDNEAQNP